MTDWPTPPPVLVQAPARAGVGLRFHYRDRYPGRWWPEDWWQRNWDEPIDQPGPPALTYRQMHVPPPPVEVVQ